MSAQNETSHFEWDIVRTGIIAVPGGGDGPDGGISFGTGLRYNLTRQYSVDIQADWMLLMGKATSSFLPFPTIEGVYTIALGVDRYFPSKNDVRWFAGASVGLYGGTELEIPDVKDQFAGSLVFGPRIGFENNLIRATIQYDITTHSRASDLLRFTAAITIWGKQDRLPNY